jgi:hypothetical protein
MLNNEIKFTLLSLLGHTILSGTGFGLAIQLFDRFKPPSDAAEFVLPRSIYSLPHCRWFCTLRGNKVNIMTCKAVKCGSESNHDAAM